MFSMIVSPNSEHLIFVAALHEAVEVVGNRLVRDRGLDALDDELRRFGPAEVLEHQRAAQDHRAGVDLVLTGVLGRGAVGRLEDRVAAVVVDVAARRDPDAANLRGERVGEVVTVEVERRDDLELLGARQYLLKRDVSDGVLDQDLARGERVGLFLVGRILPFRRDRALPLPPGVGVIGELLLGDLVTPVAERALGELHDVPLVHQGDALAAVA